MDTYFPKKGDIKNNKVVVDASGVSVGRLASRISLMLRGKHKPEYTPSQDCGDHVVVINADKSILTGNKMNKKVYYLHRGKIGSLKVTNASDISRSEILLRAVKGMLPKGRLSRMQIRNLLIFSSEEHQIKGSKKILA